MMIDLHIHTVASDGQHTASEVVAMAGEMGLIAISIADHNSVASVAEGEACAAEAGIEFAPCTELDTLFRGRDLHLLGYFLDYGSGACRAYLEDIYQGKIEQTKKRVEKLRELGFVIEFEELLEISEQLVPTGRHFIAAMKKYPENMGNPDFRAFIDGPRSSSPYWSFYLDWLKAGRPAFVPLEVQPTERAIREIKSLSGVPVLAHPSDTPLDDVHALVDQGLMGLEVYSSYHDRAATEKFLALARDRGILVTAGSDFHGLLVKPEVKLAGISGNDDRLFWELKKASGR